MERDPSISQANHETLSMIGRSGEHLLTLINDVLEMSGIEAGIWGFSTRMMWKPFLLQGKSVAKQSNPPDSGRSCRIAFGFAGVSRTCRRESESH